MRPLFAILAAALLTTGCTHTALERRTVKQASTLTDLQYQQVLDNMAMFAGNPEAMPWHVKLKGGLVQIADQGNAGFEANLASGISGEVKHIFSPSVGTQRGMSASGTSIPRPIRMNSKCCTWLTRRQLTRQTTKCAKKSSRRSAN